MHSTAGSYDVVVIGGGPAGCSTALATAQTGLKTALVEATHYERPRMSEMVPPSIHSRLKRLGVWRQFCQQGHSTIEGVLSIWGSQRPIVREFAYGPHA